ncbi:MAG: N-acetylmuramic acid 6-phosphate etherase [Schwartzia sp.]|nr:N-acetylmuramic acid 6-phosphate etherase [Schwartzia sp. (in: firmicutes)]
MIDLSRLETEKRNPASVHIDELSPLEIMRVIHEEDQRAVDAVTPLLPRIAETVEQIARRMRSGGRLIYCGAGTSGRLGVLDAAECPPTYGTPPELVIALIAGGTGAVFRAKEGAEDEEGRGETDLISVAVTELDTVVGLSASGRTPYVLGALRYAKQRGAFTVAVACSPGSPIAEAADMDLTATTGAEVVTGSTRMKAGTAQKMILNMLSTGVMISLGKVYGNLMVDVAATNEKLRERAIGIVIEVAGCTREEAVSALRTADGQAKTAILIAVGKCTKEKAEGLLRETDGRLAAALSIIKEEK